MTARRLKPAKKNGRFLRRLPLTLIAAMMIWIALRPVLDTAVSGLAEILIRAFEYPRVSRIEPKAHLAEIIRTDFRSDSRIPTIPLTENHFTTIVLLALFLALDRPFSKVQLERLAMGWCVLYFTQALNLFLHVKCLYAFSLGDWSLQTYSDFQRNFYGFLRYFTDLPGRFSFPFLIWLGFNWDRILPLLREGGPAEAPKKQKRKDTKI